jgi:hypothetical protein
MISTIEATGEGAQSALADATRFVQAMNQSNSRSRAVIMAELYPQPTLTAASNSAKLSSMIERPAALLLAEKAPVGRLDIRAT